MTVALPVNPATPMVSYYLTNIDKCELYEFNTPAKEG